MDVDVARRIVRDRAAVPTGYTTLGCAADALAAEVERLREEVRVLSSPQRLSQTLTEFVRRQAAAAALEER